MQTLSQEYLKTILHYESETGIFTRLVRTTNSVHVGDIAGSLHHSGYFHIQINGHIYESHRLAWLYTYGEFPPKHIDHKNGVRSDNRLENLRQATHFGNTQNAKLRVDNAHGHKGVSYHAPRDTWVARCQVNKTRVCIGYFKTAELASEAYQAFAKQHHGEFYRDTTGTKI